MLLNMMSMRQNQVHCCRNIISLLSLLSIICLLAMAFVFVGHLHHVSGGQRSITEAENEVEEGFWPDIEIEEGFRPDIEVEEGHTLCTWEVQMAIPLLRQAYDDSMNKVLYVGPDTDSVMPKLLLDEDDYEAWGVEPYDSYDDTDSCCWDLIQKGIVRVADMKFPLPYREKSFSHVIISDTLEYMSSRYLNETIPELMRVSRNGVIIFAGYPDFPLTEFTRYRYNREAKLRSPSWWKRYLVQSKFEEDQVAKKRFKKILKGTSYKPECQIFLLKSEN